MNRFLFSSPLACLLLLAPFLCQAQELRAEAEVASGLEAANLPKIELTPQIIYQYLLAEIAGQRGNAALAAGAHGDLAKTTRDPRIARRAAESAMAAKQLEPALDAVRLWRELEPASIPARQMLANLLVAGKRMDELGALLAQDLANDGPRLGESLMHLGRVLARYPDKAAVAKLIDQLTLPYERLPEAHFARAQSAANVREALRAMMAIERALELRPDWELAALFKAQLLDRSPAQTAFLKTFVAANPKAADVRLAYARALVGEKRYEEARREFRTVREAAPDNVDVIYAQGILALQLDDAADAERQLRRVLELGNGDLNSVRFYLGQIAEEGRRVDEALSLYTAVVAGEQQLPAILRSAQLLARENRADEARKKLIEARVLAPKEEPRLLIAEAQLLREAGRHEEALGLLNGGLERHPDSPDLLYESSLAAEKLDQLDLAERRLRRLIELQPDQATGYNALGYSFVDRNVRLDEAQQLIDKALELSPGDPFILASKGWLLFRQGQAESALTPLRQAYAQRSDAEIAAHLGEVLWVLGRRDEARALWNEASKAHPSNTLLSSTIKRLTP